MTNQLSPADTLAIDGVLNESAWAAVPWLSESFVDITHHEDDFLNAVPPNLQVVLNAN